MGPGEIEFENLSIMLMKIQLTVRLRSGEKWPKGLCDCYN